MSVVVNNNKDNGIDIRKVLNRTITVISFIVFILSIFIPSNIIPVYTTFIINMLVSCFVASYDELKRPLIILLGQVIINSLLIYLSVV